mmetsp:Transcript_60566/g.91380  ORF Transcript_60566/g.91380 Transcript_60566/m.91380 type:complete len:156 (-) Transcript_60566:150-617(-)
MPKIRSNKKQQQFFFKTAATMISLKAYATGMFLFSSFFWIWALKNTIGMDAPNWDFGLGSFVTVMVSTSYVMALANNKVVPAPGKLTRFFVIASCVLVALNYMLGTYIGYAVLERTGFAVYCLVFTFLWFGLAGLGFQVTSAATASSSAEGQSLL